MIGKTNEQKLVPSIAQNFKRIVLLTLLAVAAFGLLLSTSFVAVPAMATPGSGVSSTPIATGDLSDPVRMKLKYGGGFGDGVDVSRIAIVKNIVQPGGYFGWHQHGGPSWIVVTQGTLTFYEAGDPTCTGHNVSQGEAFLDLGNHTHNARNETGQVAENYVVRMFPAGAPTRIDITPGPATCPF